MQKKQKRGFTLIEILIVVAIIAILASVVLIGLGPTQRAGRDARRISDLHEVQTALQLYYNHNAKYPSTADYATLITDLEGDATIGVTQVPNDPNNASGATYSYSDTDSGQNYVIGAQLETGSQVFNGYNAPANIGGVGGWFKLDCKGSSDLEYCLSL